MFNQVIYINGPSSSGKTTIARMLQDKILVPYLYISIDLIIEFMPKKLNDFTGKSKTIGYYFEKNKLVVGEYAKTINPLFHKIVLTMLENGHNVIIDDISFGKVQVDIWRDDLKNYNVLWIGVTASDEVLELREKVRGDRKMGTAVEQNKIVHNGVNYDKLIDTSVKQIDEVVEDIMNL